MQVVDAVPRTSRVHVALYRVPQTVPRVRIPPSPPYSLKCREIRLGFSGNCRKWAQFRYSCLKAGPEKVHCWMLQVSLAAFFSGGHWSSPVSRTPSGECNAIRNRSRGESHLTLPRGCFPNSVPTRLFAAISDLLVAVGVVFFGKNSARPRVLPMSPLGYKNRLPS